MKIAVQGSKSFDDYNVFLRAMGTALSRMGEDKSFEIYAAGPVNLNNMAIGYANISEDGFRGRGMTVSCHKRPLSWFEKNLEEMEHFAFFKKPGEENSQLFAQADKLLKENAFLYEFK